MFKGNLPFYFVFITCPYNEYDINEKFKTLELQFKDWDKITKILEKLISFYTGDLSLKEVHQVTNTNEKKPASDTRDEVKKIMEKILASNSRKLGVSQMQNGIKGTYPNMMALKLRLPDPGDPNKMALKKRLPDHGTVDLYSKSSNVV